MPGMMNTDSEPWPERRNREGLARKTGNPRFAYDSYRRFIQMFADVVIGVDGKRFEHELQRYKTAHGKTLDAEMSAEDWQAIIATYKTFVAFPQDPFEQLQAGPWRRCFCPGTRRAPTSTGR